MVLQTMTRSAQSAVNMANITPWAHELRDTEADTMKEPSRDKLNKVGQVATPTHDALGLGSNDLGGPGKWFNWSVLGHSDAMAVRAETKSKIAFYGTIASGVQTTPMSTEVNGEHLGGVRSFTAPLGREMPLTDLLGLWGPQTRTGVGLITQRTGGPTDIASSKLFCV